MENLKKIGCFILLFLYVMGVIGGIGSAIYAKSYPCAIGVAVCAIFAIPTVKDIFSKLS